MRQDSSKYCRARLIAVQNDGPKAAFQGVDFERLEKIAIHFAFCGSSHDVLGDFTANHEEWCSLIVWRGPQVPEEVNATHARHIDIADHEVERPLLEDLPGLLPISGLLDVTLDSQMLEHLAEHPADGRDIIH